ncbi:MAG: thioredoxin domain-containing protein [Chloroflexota bacterium]
MTPDDFFERLRKNPLPVVVDFWAPWCGPCRMIEPALKRLESQYQGRVDVWKVNADEQPDLLKRLRIYGIPTLASFNAGQEVVRQTGAGSMQSMTNLFEAALSGEKPVKAGLTLPDRLLRLGAGLGLLYLAYSSGFAGFYLLLAGLSGVVMFTAVYDRCPIWQALSPRLQALFKRD